MRWPGDGDLPTADEDARSLRFNADQYHRGTVTYEQFSNENGKRWARIKERGPEHEEDVLAALRAGPTLTDSELKHIAASLEFAPGEINPRGTKR